MIQHFTDSNATELLASAPEEFRGSDLLARRGVAGRAPECKSQFVEHREIRRNPEAYSISA